MQIARAKALISPGMAMPLYVQEGNVSVIIYQSKGSLNKNRKGAEACLLLKITVNKQLLQLYNRKAIVVTLKDITKEHKYN